MAEEQGQNRPNNITRKKIKIEEEEDRISSLPDCLLIEIISRLDSTKEAFKTSTLSKRWQHLCPFVTNLIFKIDDHNSSDTFFSFVDRTLSQHHKAKLNKLQLIHTSWYDNRYESHVNKCIRHAISCDVQDLDLSLECHRRQSRYFIDYELVFINSYFTRLKLSCCMINPTRVISWNKLTSLCISNGRLDEDSIQNILCGSPILETLNLHKCYGFRRIDITSKSVKKLVLSGYMNTEDKMLTVINAPNILSLTIQKSLLSRRFVLVDVYSLVETTLDCTTTGTCVIREEDMLKALMQSLRHVKEVKLGYFFSKVLSRLEAKGFTVPSNIKYHDIFLLEI